MAMIIKLTSFVTVIFVLIQFKIQAQNYDFDDGNIPSDWIGQPGYFDISSSKQLHLNAPTGSTSATVSWPCIQAETKQWEFYVGYDFAASSTNYASFYLLSADTDLSAATNTSYYVKVGGATGSTDKIELIYQEGSTKYVVAESAEGLAGTSTVSCRIRVCMSANGLWELYADTSGRYNFDKITAGQHQVNKTFPYSGIRCVYSSTRRDKFYFDDIRIKKMFALQSYSFLTDTKLKIYFSDTLRAASIEATDTDFGVPFASRIKDDYLLIEFTQTLNAGNYNAVIKDVISIHGDTLLNVSVLIKKEVIYYAGQLRITEWMSDPSPSAGLPEIEWVEVLNTSADIIDMSVCSIADPSSIAQFPAYMLQPDSVVVVCSSGGCSQMGIQNCLEVQSLPSLNNSSDSIFLWAKDSILLDVVHYELALLPKDYRSAGGYSIIRKNLPLDCVFAQELDFSSAQTGGTPGFTNDLTIVSSFKTVARIISADLLVIDATIIGNVDYSNVSSPLPIYTVYTAYSLYASHFNIVFGKSLEEGSATYIHLDSIRTCRNKPLFVDENIQVIYPKAIQTGDVFVNEVLYNPYTGGVDFIELYNASPDYVQLKNTHYYNEIPDKPLQHSMITSNAIIEPYGYRVLTADSVILKEQYKNTISENCIQLDDFLSLPDTGGNLLFVSNGADTLDRVSYGDAFQNPLNRSDEGISLEKIVASKVDFSSGSWTSSAVKCTPGYINSQHYSDINPSESPFYCNPCHVTTNLNGANDYVLLHLNQKAGGCFATISIYRLSGEKIQDLCMNQLLGSSNTFQWNGQQYGTGPLQDGIYVAVAEWWSPGGESFTSKIAISTSQY